MSGLVPVAAAMRRAYRLDGRPAQDPAALPVDDEQRGVGTLEDEDGAITEQRGRRDLRLLAERVAPGERAVGGQTADEDVGVRLQRVVEADEHRRAVLVEETKTRRDPLVG